MWIDRIPENGRKRSHVWLAVRFSSRPDNLICQRVNRTTRDEHSKRIMALNSDHIQHADFSTPTRRVMSAASLASDSVRNSAGEPLGCVADLLIDLPSGRVAYAVLSFGGFLGFDNKLFPIPWEALTLDEDQKCFILDSDKGILAKAPGFDKDHWPDMADSSWSTDVHNFYGYKPYWDKNPDGRELQGGSVGASETDEMENKASGEYARNVQQFSRSERVGAQAIEAERAIEGPEGESLKPAYSSFHRQSVVRVAGGGRSVGEPGQGCADCADATRQTSTVDGVLKCFGEAEKRP